MTSEVQEQFLIIGAGPSGVGLAAFLGQNGLKGLVISQASGTADTPRAHSLNPFGLECLRDIGLEDAVVQQANQGSVFQGMRWCRSMVGEEYGRVLTWSDHPSSMGMTRASSPCEYSEFVQSLMEPLLLKYATHNNFEVRFSTELVSIERLTSTSGGSNTSSSLCTLYDRITKHTFKIRTQYLFGADGARSHVARSLDFKFDSKPGGRKACNVLFRAELGNLLNKERHSGLHWIMKPDRTTFPGVMGHLRTIKLWNEWILVCFGSQDTNPLDGLTPKSPELIAYIRELIGVESVDIEVLRIDPWTVRESIAEQYSQADSNAFLLGDAAHRHPPAYGLGSNTCVQDAYNLAWKVAYVSKGLAGPGLLDSYSEERQPVGHRLVHSSNSGIHAHADVWRVLGIGAPTPEEGIKELAKLSEPTSEGRAQRAKLHDALQIVEQEVQSLGAAYNQWYTSKAVYLQDEANPRPALVGNPITQIQISTYPGSRLPHAWLDVPTRQKILSTQDLAGNGAFCLLLGVGGNAWREAARKITQTTGIPINVYGIGHGLEYIDVYRDWFRYRGVNDDGCVLVRPDRFVAWRSSEVVSDCEGKLAQVLNHVLSRDEL